MAYQISHINNSNQFFLVDIECMPREELDSLQGCLLAQTVRRARRAPFYAPRLAEMSEAQIFLSPEEFQQRVPLTSKQDLRLAGSAAWSAEKNERMALLLATTGTTGARIALPYTHDDLRRWGDLAARTLWANGFRPQDVVLLPVPLGLFSGGHGMFNGLARLGCTVIPTGPLHTPQLAEVLRGELGVSPTAIVSLPTHMLRLLDSLPQIGYDPASSPLRLGSFGAEAWTESARARIEQGFGLRAMDSYGIGELCGPGIAAECVYRDGMHVWEDAFFIEVIDPQTGEPVPDGMQGELVLTSLFREYFPLLRYRTGDAAAIIPGECACGRTHRRMTRIPRRLDNILIITGINVDPADVETMLYGFPWLANEFYLEAGGTHRDELVLHVERNAGVQCPPEAEKTIADAIRRTYPVRMHVQIHDAGQLERIPGKAQRIRG